MPSKSAQSIIIANDLRTGRSVYYTGESQWSESVQDAELLIDDALAQSRLNAALKSEQANLVIDPYLIGVEPNLSATDIRESIRVSGGPTIFEDTHNAVTQAA